MFIEHFAIVASPLQRLTRKGEEWSWTEACEVAFNKLKRIVGLDITLKDLDYSKGGIQLAVDSSKFGAGGVLSQDEEGKDWPVLYESVTFTEVESRYSQPKLELCGVTKVVRRLQHLLWGVFFELLVDGEALARMINSPSLPNAMGGVSATVLFQGGSRARESLYDAACPELDTIGGWGG
jgi:hypothetical protein